MERSVKEKAALCVNATGQWSLRTSGYVALPNVRIEGLQRNRFHDGLEQTKVARIFKTLNRVRIDAEWIWTVVLAVPAPGITTTNVNDEMLITDIINMLPEIYALADSVIILDALNLQLHTDDVLDVAVILLCGKWVTRVWTYQEIKLASHAVIITADAFFAYQDVIDRLKDLEEQNKPRFRASFVLRYPGQKFSGTLANRYCLRMRIEKFWPRRGLCQSLLPCPRTQMGVWHDS